MVIGAIIQARLGSNRLPNKVLKNLPFFSEETILSNIISRIKKVKGIDKTIVATTINFKDDLLEKYCKANKISYFRGSEENVLERYYLASKNFNLDVIIRLTSDNPLIDIELLEETIEYFKNKGNLDYLRTKNTPLGMGVEIFSFKALEKNYLNSNQAIEKEHVTPYFYKTCPEKFRIKEYESKKYVNNDNFKGRFTIDTLEDYTFMCCIFDELYNNNKFFSLKEVKELFMKKPWLNNINSSIEKKKTCSNLEEEIEEALRLLNKQDLNRAEKYLKEEYYGK